MPGRLSPGVLSLQVGSQRFESPKLHLLMRDRVHAIDRGQRPGLMRLSDDLGHVGHSADRVCGERYRHQIDVPVGELPGHGVVV